MIRRSSVAVLAALTVVALTPSVSEGREPAGGHGSSHGMARLAGGDHEFHVFAANIGSGSECNPDNKGTFDCLSVVDHQIAKHPGGFDAVTVEEACQDDVKEFKSKHRSWDVEYQPDDGSAPNECGTVKKNGKTVSRSHGNFIAAPTLTDRTVTRLPDPPNTPANSRHMFLLCGKAQSFTICVVHLPFHKSGKNVHPEEIAKIAKTIEGLKRKVVLCGDFNMHSSDPAFDTLRKDYFKQGALDNHERTRVPFDHIWWHNPKNALVGHTSSHAVHQPKLHFDHDMLQGTSTF